MNTAEPAHPDAATARMVELLRTSGVSYRPDGAPLVLRRVLDTDGPVLTRLIADAYDEFGCGPADPGGFDADLAMPASYAQQRARRWWVVTDEHDVVLASAAHSELRPAPDPAPDGTFTVELQRLYLAPSARGSGLASLLIRGIASEAQLLGASRLIAWSDTRLTAAHTRYLAIGFSLADASRRLDDPAGSVEIRFELALPLG